MGSHNPLLFEAQCPRWHSFLSSIDMGSHSWYSEHRKSLFSSALNLKQRNKTTHDVSGTSLFSSALILNKEIRQPMMFLEHHFLAQPLILNKEIRQPRVFLEHPKSLFSSTLDLKQRNGLSRTSLFSSPRC